MDCVASILLGRIQRCPGLQNAMTSPGERMSAYIGGSWLSPREHNDGVPRTPISCSRADSRWKNNNVIHWPAPAQRCLGSQASRSCRTASGVTPFNFAPTAMPVAFGFGFPVDLEFAVAPGFEAAVLHHPILLLTLAKCVSTTNPASSSPKYTVATRRAILGPTPGNDSSCATGL